MERFDCIIVGGGLVGQSLSIALATAGLDLALVERDDPDAQLGPGFDGRASAIASAPARMLRALGLGDLLDGEGCPIRAIRVTDGLDRRHLHFDSAEADPAEPLGIMVENRALRAALLARVRSLAAINLLAPAQIEAVRRDAHAATVVLAGGSTLVAPLLIAADGRRSALREAAGIRCARWSYPASGIVSMFAHQRPHCEVASEIFYPSGPFAQLPMRDLADGRHRSALVWTVPADQAAAVTALGERALAAEVERRLGGFLGGVSMLAPAVAWPLGLHHAERYAAGRLLLVGDAAHGIHPIAGQGLNLGLRDVAALADILVEGARLGLDLGHPDLARRYERARRADNSMTAAATDALARLFSVPGRPAAAIRRSGLAAVNRIAPLKRWFMATARGEQGRLPALLRGELP